LAKGKRTRFDLYLASAFLAYGIATTIDVVLSLVFSAETIYFVFGIIATCFPPFFGGLGATYITKGQIGDNYVRTGLIGIGAFFVDFAMSVATSGRFDGMIWILLGYISGVCAGSWVRDQPWAPFKR